MDRVLETVLVLSALSLCAYGAMMFVDDPMEARRARLEEELRTIRPMIAEYSTAPTGDLGGLRAAVTSKPSLWEELIPAPAAPPRRKMPPNLQQKLQGVVPTRTSIGTGEAVKVLIKSTNNPRGSFLGVGEKVNGVAVLKIEKTSVLFGVTQNGTRYTHSVPRRYGKGSPS